MGPSSQVALFLALLAFGSVSCFSISHRSERNTDLAEALAILQRQRRRVGVEDFLNSERLLEGRPLTLDDVNDWLRRSNENDVMNNGENWLSDSGNFKEFEPSDMDGYGLSPEVVLPPARVKASPDEVNDIFSNDNDDSGEESSEFVNETPEKKTKEEMINIQGDKQAVNKPVQRSLEEASVSDDLGSREALNSLTDEEVRVLMKAVGKLQQRAAEMSKVKKSNEMSEMRGHDMESDIIEVSPSEQEVIISEPVTQEELKSVFSETEGPITKETKIIANKGPGQDAPVILGQEILSEKLPDDSTLVSERELTNTLPQAIENELEAEREEQEFENNNLMEGEENELDPLEPELLDAEEAAEEAAAVAQEEEDEEEEQEQIAEEEAAVEQATEDAVAEEIANMSKDRLSPELVSKYLLMNRDKLYNLQPSRQGLKRTAKRASGFYANELIKDDDDEDNDDDNNDNDMNDVANLNINGLQSSTLIQAFVTKILSLQDEIDNLRFKNRLEDLENDELTDALNEATIGQKEGTVSNVEWKSLQHAIEIEQALQDLKSRDKSAPIEAKHNVKDVGEDSENKRKRGELWKRERGQEADNDVVYNGAIASRTPSKDRDISREDIERLLASAYLMKEDEEEEEEEEGGEEVPQGGDENELVASLFLSNADRCPAIQRYSNNCELADLYNLPVDFEARALCNLHEMCYACGHSLGVSQPQCDLVYRAAVSSLCHQKEVCVAESEIFLRTMKLKTRYIPHVQPTCRSRCTAQFMGMF